VDVAGERAGARLAAAEFNISRGLSPKPSLVDQKKLFSPPERPIPKSRVAPRVPSHRTRARSSPRALVDELPPPSTYSLARARADRPPSSATDARYAMAGGPKLPTDVRPNQFVEANAYAREVVERGFRFSPKNLGVIAIFGAIIPWCMYKGITNEFVRAPPDRFVRSPRSVPFRFVPRGGDETR
jgi:hypothetical protein